MDYQELIERMRGFEIDHEPNGWPAIQMRDISAMCDAIESLLADNDKTLAGVIANVEKQRDELLAALERFMDSHEECTDFDGFTAQIVGMADYHQAQEVIEIVKGGVQ